MSRGRWPFGWSPGHRWPRERARAGPASTSSVSSIPRLVEGELETNVTMDAEDLLLRQFLGIRTEEETRLAANWIRSKQRADGRGQTSTAGRGPFNHHRGLRGAAWPGRPGGGAHGPGPRVHPEPRRTENARVFTHVAGPVRPVVLGSDPGLPPEVIFLPEWFPLNIYDFACWARQTIVALTVVGAHRPNRPLGFSIDELRTGTPRTMASLPRPGRGGSSTWIGPFSGTSATRPLVFATSPWPEPPNGSFAGRRRTELGWIQPPWCTPDRSAPHGVPLDHSVMRLGSTGWIVDRGVTSATGGVPVPVGTALP